MRTWLAMRRVKRLLWQWETCTHQMCSMAEGGWERAHARDLREAIYGRVSR